MLHRVGLIELHAAVRALIEEKTVLKCYDLVGRNIKAPFVHFQLVRTEPHNNKTMYRERVVFLLHVYASSVRGREEIYEKIREVEEAMTVQLPLPGVELLSQTYSGVTALYQESEVDECHAVLEYHLEIGYGYKIKA